MSPHPLTTALFLLAGCGEADHDHAHDHDAASGHEHASPASTPAAAPAPAAASAPAAAPADFALGAWTARLEASADGLRLTARDASGAAVAPTGEARVVLTGTGQAEQRVVLAADEAGWSGPAQAAGAPGYIAVVSLEVDGHAESARVSWGEVPAAAPAPQAAEPAHEHEAGTGDGHDHGHGH